MANDMKGLRSSAWLVLLLAIGVFCLIRSSWAADTAAIGDDASSSGRSSGYSSHEFNRTYHGNVSQGKEDQYIFTVEDGMKMSSAIRVHVEGSNANSQFPILFVVRQQKGIMSWPIPMTILSLYEYDAVARTLCPMDFGNTTINEVVIDVSCSSANVTYYTLNVTIVDDFDIFMSKPQEITVSPSRPKYYYFKFPSNTDAVQVRGYSDDDICATISVQETTCPVFDLNRNVEFTGIYQTQTSQSSITVQGNDFQKKEFFIVVVVHPDDADCNGLTKLQPALPTENSLNMNHRHVAMNPLPGIGRIKTITISIVPTISRNQYWKAVMGVVAFFMSFYLFSFAVFFIQWYRKRDKSEDVESSQRETAGDSTEDPSAPIGASKQPSYGTGEMRHACELPSSQTTFPPNGQPSVQHDEQPSLTRRRRLSSDSSIDNISLDDSDIDMLHDIEQEKDVYRTKTFLYVSDLSRKDRKTLRKKYKLYHWNLLPIAVFYALPVIQLVITYQTIFNKTGNEDICYYNFLCANPLGVISAFNNIFSNMGYILLGILFLFVTWREDLIHKNLVESNDEMEKNYGIPKHFGLFYALGIALVMEGVLSGCYHVCPTYSNFQFDTSFMYIIAGLGILKLYQTRHPDINANAYIAYACFALVIFLAVLGVIFGTLYFWILFAVLHIVTCCVLTAQLYYMGRWKLDLGIFKRIYLVMKTDCLSCARPMYTDRMILLIFGNAINWSLAIYGVITQPHDFASYLLAIFIINSMLYLAFYIIMKLRFGERIVLRAFVFIVLTCAFWAAALYFFLQGLAQWDKTPAVSREGNRDCILFDFYDHHDVWHFLSACAMFFSFMTLLTLDDDLDKTPRTKIPVF